MNIAAIRKINEQMPYWMKRPFSRIIRRKLIENSVFSEQYGALVEADAMDEEEKSRRQKELLEKTLAHAYEHTDYYRRLFDQVGLRLGYVDPLEALADIPVLTKELLRENYNALQADDIDNYYEVSTGGTTGAPIHVLMEKDAIYREWAFTYHYWSKFGYDYEKSRLATFRGVDLNNKLSEINPLYQEIRMNVFLMSRNNIAEYVKRIEKYGADFIYGYPSSVYNFCRLTREAGIPVKGRFKAALLISENLYPFQEEELTRTLDCPIAIFYGHSERAVYGERYGEGYVFQPQYGVTEIAKDNTLIVTGFINRKMPLIRYTVDDEAEPVANGGVSIRGHWNADLLDGKNGERISAAAINFHDGTFDGVEKYQFVQREAGRCILNVVPSGETLVENRVRAIEKSVRQKFGAALTCEIRLVKELETTSRGKYQMVIRRGG